METNQLDYVHYKLHTLYWIELEIHICSTYYDLLRFWNHESLLLTSGGKVRCDDVIYVTTEVLQKFTILKGCAKH